MYLIRDILKNSGYKRLPDLNSFTLSQIIEITGIEKSTIQNWVKRGYLSRPISKKYTKRQLSRIVIINLLRKTMQIDKITGLLTYVNGRLDDESDDIIDDTEFYNYIEHIINYLDQSSKIDEKEIENQIEICLGEYVEPVQGALDRLKNALFVMVMSLEAAKFKKICEDKMEEIIV